VIVAPMIDTARTAARRETAGIAGTIGLLPLLSSPCCALVTGTRARTMTRVTILPVDPSKGLVSLCVTQSKAPMSLRQRQRLQQLESSQPPPTAADDSSSEESEGEAARRPKGNAFALLMGDDDNDEEEEEAVEAERAEVRGGVHVRGTGSDQACGRFRRGHTGNRVSTSSETPGNRCDMGHDRQCVGLDLLGTTHVLPRGWIPQEQGAVVHTPPPPPSAQEPARQSKSSKKRQKQKVRFKAVRALRWPHAACGRTKKGRRACNDTRSTL
jgi:hypothetical protein